MPMVPMLIQDLPWTFPGDCAIRIDSIMELEVITPKKANAFYFRKTFYPSVSGTLPSLSITCSNCHLDTQNVLRSHRHIFHSFLLNFPPFFFYHSLTLLLCISLSLQHEAAQLTGEDNDPFYLSRREPIDTRGLNSGFGSSLSRVGKRRCTACKRDLVIVFTHNPSS